MAQDLVALNPTQFVAPLELLQLSTQYHAVLSPYLETVRVIADLPSATAALLSVLPHDSFPT